MFTNSFLNKIFLPFVVAGGLAMSNALANDEIVDEGEIVQSGTADGAVILLFHRFGEDKYPSTNIRTEQLDNLIDYLQQNKFNVIPLKQAIDTIQNGGKLPEKSIVITIDDAFKSIYTVAHPKFKQAGFPYTVFVSSGGVNKGIPAYMSWDEIAELANDGVDIQAHTIKHQHMTQQEIGNNDYEVSTNINEIINYTGITPNMFAYPYGEANNEIIDLVKSKNIKAGFSQHSGVYNSTSNQYYIPRFSINEKWGTLKRLKLILNTKPFKVKSITPEEPYIRENNPPMISVVVDESVGNISNLNCFRSDTGKIPLEISGDTFDMTFTTPFKTGRTRINCTLPDKKGGFKWLGLMFTRDN